MKAYTYIEKGKFALIDKPKPELQEATDAIVRVTLGSICSSDLHIKHGSVPRAVPGITVGHEMVGVVEEVGADVKGVKVGDRVTVNVETFCGECFYCRHGYVNNCTSPHGGWALGCRIDGGQTEYVRVPLASQGLNRIPDSVTDEQANETIGVIRKAVARKYGQECADKVRIQYGGSMNPKNVKGLMAQPEIDGGLIGGASLKAPDFSLVVNYDK